jgi:hypothetical protein
LASALILLKKKRTIVDQEVDDEDSTSFLVQAEAQF